MDSHETVEEEQTARSNSCLSFPLVKNCGARLYPLQQCCLRPLYLTEFRFELLEKTFPGEKRGGRNSLAKPLWLAMETAPWRGEKKEGGHGCYSNEIRREKTAIAGTNRGPVENFPIAQLRGSNYANGARGSWLSFRASSVRRARSFAILDDARLLCPLSLTLNSW